MKVLYVTNSVDKNGKGGDYIYSNQLFDTMSGIKSWDVKLLKLCPNSPVNDLSFLKKIGLLFFSLCFPFMWREATKIYTYNKNQKNVHEYDAVVIDHFRCAWYYFVLKKQGYKGELILIQHNVESKVALESFYNAKKHIKIIYLYEYIKLFLFEKFLFERFDKISCISESDFKSCSKIKNTSCFIIKPAFEQEFLVDQPGKDSNNKALIIGSFYWKVKRDNLLRLLDSFKVIDNRKPNGFCIIIAGSMPSDFQDVLLNNYNFIELKNNFESLHDLINLAGVAIAPDDVGGGFKLKLLDYLSLGLPIYGIKGAMSGCEEVISSVKSYKNFPSLAESLFVDVMNQDYIIALSKDIISLRDTNFSKETLIYSVQQLLNKNNSN